MISGFLWRGPPRRIINLAALRKIRLCGTDATYKEFCRVISYPKFSKKLKTLHFSLQRLTLDYITLVSIFPEPPHSHRPIIAADPDDDIFVYAAIASRTNIIVSGDNHLLEMQEARGVHILRASEFIKLNSFLEERRKTPPGRFPRHPRLLKSI